MASLDDAVLRAIRRVFQRVAEHSRHLARDAGLTVPQILVLRAVASGDPTLGEVSGRVNLSPATVSRIVDRLERGGLVTRQRAATDRRQVRLALTPAGAERLSTSPAPLQERFLARLHALPVEEQRALLGALEQVVALMDAGDLDVPPVLSATDDSDPPAPRRHRDS
ncbi:MAG: MarR family winged helix-turn-helix transcriptional regulator [bacterium]